MTQPPDKTNHDLKATIVAELAWTPAVNADQVGVAICNGAVTLSGQVSTYPEKQAAVSAALRVRGVLAVADEIAVRTAGQRTDSEIAGEAQAALEKIGVPPAGAVSVTVRQGMIRLAGAVGWQYERQAALRAVTGLPGVVEVLNSITLDPPVTISSTEATRRITAALVRNARVDAEHITVTISGTEVRLSGKVSSWAERHQAEYAGWSTPGVTHVDNRLAIVSSTAR